MASDRSQTASMENSTHSLRDRSHSRHRRPSVREQSGSEKEENHLSRTSSAGRSDVNSETSRYNKTRGPVNDAVQSAFKPVDPSHSAISPEILSQITSQITASVLQQLKAESAKQEDAASSTHGSPPLDRRHVYTPPSPYRASEGAASRRMSTSPKRERHQKLPSPPNTRRPISPPFSHGTLSDDNNETKEAPAKRPHPVRQLTDGDATIVEKIWGKLFDEEKGLPTLRLSQFLRGIAVHLIEDYEPKHSLVVTPEKMQRYYEDSKIPSEIYPWQVVFDDRTSCISRMFREVKAQHHLTQDSLSDRPDIPGLTPKGFETWMTLVLKAHPDEEFHRLAYTALNMPISNPDDKKERFAKEVSRRQFPKESDEAAASQLQSIIATHCRVKITRQPSTVPDQDTKHSHTNSKSTGSEQPHDQTSHNSKPQPPTDYTLSQTSTYPDHPSLSEQERLNLRPTVSDAAVDNDDHPVLSKPIERERQPYTALPGGGKSYNHPESQTTSDDKPHSHPIPPSKLGRSTSLSGRTSDNKPRPLSISIHQKPNLSSSQPVDIPLRTHASGLQHHHHSQTDRNRSPSNTRNTDWPSKPDEFGSYHSVDSYRTDKTSDRYDRESRPRYQSVSEDARYHYVGDHHRASNAAFPASDSNYSQYPPNSYRGRT